MMLQHLRNVRTRYKKMHRARGIAAIGEILSAPGEPDTRRSETEFDLLQKSFQGVPEYGYDLSSLFARAAARSVTLLERTAAGNRKLKILELGAGDGMLGTLLAAAGHEVVLSDLEDWRTPSAKHLRFVAGDCCDGLPFETEKFDLVCSFNSFEHFSDPRRAFREAFRLTKHGGLLHLDFGPLYCSPWGLHAYRSLKMPYPQFLFSEEFITAKLAGIGIWDLGKERSELQYVNQWRLSQFEPLWTGEGCSMVKFEQHRVEDYFHLVRRYPEAFRGRGLTFDDLTCANLIVTVRNTRGADRKSAIHSLAVLEPAGMELS